MSDEYVLVTEGLTKEFAGFTAVRDVNLRVKRGSIHALIEHSSYVRWLMYERLAHGLMMIAGTR